jgi:predicted transcriptional regulator
MTKKITIKTGSLKEAAKEFVHAWHQAENKRSPKAVVEKITFKDQYLLFKIMTPKRLEILQYVHGQDDVSIRSLATALGRDYSNVHQDVKVLHKLGLMLKNKDDKYHVPWDVIVAEIPLHLTKKSKNTRYTGKQKLRTSHG